MALPADIRRFFGFSLSFAQQGGQHDAAKVLKGFGGAGVLEIVEDDTGAPTEQSIRSSSRKLCSSCMLSRKRVSVGLKHRKKTWKLFATA